MIISLLLSVIPLLFTSTARAAELRYSSNWAAASHRWAGPHWWANPLHQWSIRRGHATSQSARARTLCLTSYSIGPTDQSLIFDLSVNASVIAPPRRPSAERPAVWFSAGFRVGVKGRFTHYLSSLIDPLTFTDATLSSDRNLRVARQMVRTAFHTPLAPEVRLRLRATRRNATAVRLVFSTPFDSVETVLPLDAVLGTICLLNNGVGQPRDDGLSPVVKFSAVSLRGHGVRYSRRRRIAPVVWTTYTLSRGVLRVQAQLMPIAVGRSVPRAFLYIKPSRSSARWVKAGVSKMDALARTVAFSVPRWNASQRHDFLVRVAWRGQWYSWRGTVRAEPALRQRRLKIGVFSCDDGYLFPQRVLVRDVLAHDPDLVFFAGDQIYEYDGRFPPGVTDPTPVAGLDYLRKYYRFGLTWRTVLRDRPAIIIPDDHDVYQGNLFGHGGRALPLPSPAKARVAGQRRNKNRRAGIDVSEIDPEAGGYYMPGRFVAAVEKTQTGNLPPPATPGISLPIGISPFFTRVDYGGVSFAVLEDRKFKTGPKTIADESVRLTGGSRGVLLGAAQERFVARWAADWVGHRMKVALSATIFAKATTHGGFTMRRQPYCYDTGGWPFAARNRAMKLLARARALTLHGDQHLGILARLDDGAGNPVVSFMTPGTATRFTRAWWPRAPGARNTGNFTDDCGHRVHILGVGNPDVGSELLDHSGNGPLPLTEVAYRKASGYGMVTLDKETRKATVQLYRIGRRSMELFDGFPITVHVGGAPRNNI